MQDLNITRENWPLTPACVEDFLDRTLTRATSATGKALFAKLKWTVAHLNAPLQLNGALLPAPTLQTKRAGALWLLNRAW